MRKRENLQVSMRDVVLMEVFHRLDELVKVVLDQVFWESRRGKNFARQLTTSHPVLRGLVKRDIHLVSGLSPKKSEQMKAGG